MSSGSVTTSYVEPEHELARVQDERLVALRLDLAGQVGLVRGRVDVRVAVVLEDPEEPVEAHVDRGRLQHRRVEGVQARSGRRRSRPGCRGLTAARAHPTGRGGRARPPRPVSGRPTASRRMAPCRSTATSPSATRSPRASATPTRPAPTACAAGPTGSRRCSPTAGADDFGYANLAIRGRKLRRDPRRAARAGARARARPGHDLRRRQRHPAPAGRPRRPGRASTTPRWAGSPPPAPGCWCGPPSTRAARRSTARCAAGSPSTTSWSARAPTGTAPPSSTSGACGSTATGGYWDADRMHMGPAGHQRMAIEVLDTLGVAHDLAPLPLARRRASAAAASSCARTSTGPASSARALGAPPAHRPLLGRHRRARATRCSRLADALAARPCHRAATDELACADPPAVTADVAQLVERDLPKVDVASSSLVIRSTFSRPARSGSATTSLRSHLDRPGHSPRLTPRTPRHAGPNTASQL